MSSIETPIGEMIDSGNAGEYSDDERTDYEPDQPEDGLTDAEADAQTLMMAGMGTDEDYGRFAEDPCDF